ncbi:hypothetical protein ACVWYN_003449 [Pedobacter sp. UYP24]
MNGIAYMIQVNLYLILFYGLYIALLRKETFFKMNRFYLVGSAMLSLAIPLFNSAWVQAFFVTDQVHHLTQTFNTIVNSSTLVTTGTYEITTTANQLEFGLATWVAIIYSTVTLLLLLNFLRKLYAVNLLLKSGSNGKAFSFFNKIAIDEKMEGKDTILEHELVHVRQWHSADVLFFEILTAINWFNPISYAYKKSISNIHEFIADETAASSLKDKAAYAMLLVSNSFNTQPEHLTNNFYNKSLLKRRLIMLNKNKSKKVAILKYGLTVPLFAVMIIFSSATAAGKRVINAIEETTAPALESQSNTELEPLIETEQMDLKVNVPKIRLTNEPIKDSIKIESPIVKVGHQTNITKMLDSIDGTRPKNLVKYISLFFKGSSLDLKEGTVYYSFDVSKGKKISNIQIIRSIDSDWEKNLLSYLRTFKDTVSLAEGSYNFFQGIAFFDLNDPVRATGTIFIPKPGQPALKFLFGSTITSSITISTADETKEEAGKIVNYIKVDYIKNPIILVDGKIAKYKITDKGFRLDETIYPKHFDTKVYRGDKAVANYNESARKGLIVITTYPSTPQKD